VKRIDDKKKLVVVSTTPKMVRFFLLNHISYFSEAYDITVLSNYNEQSEILNVLSENVKQYNIPIVRDIKLYMDIKALFLLIIFFYREKPFVVYSISPKGGGLSMVSAWLMRVPIRIHTFTGQVWVNKKGVVKHFLRFIDKLTSLCATTIFVDSLSQRNFIVENKVVSKEKTIVIGDGSISGVDLTRFFPSISIRNKIRAIMNIDQLSIVFLFVGRLKRDKGVFELTNALVNVSNKIGHVQLWLVGDDEDNVQSELECIVKSQQCIVKFIPYVTDPEKYMQAADVFCLPSYREGFGSTIIEAAACAIPSIGSRIYGVIDAIVDGRTGILVEKKNVEDLSKAMLRLAHDHQLRTKMGVYARNRAIEKFDANIISKELVDTVRMLQCR